jgi:hypothetical protein
VGVDESEDESVGGDFGAGAGPAHPARRATATSAVPPRSASFLSGNHVIDMWLLNVDDASTVQFATSASYQANNSVFVS